MRIFAVPAAILLSCCLYMPLPRAEAFFSRLLVRMYERILLAFTHKSGKTDDDPALIVYLLVLGGVMALLGAIHPLAAMALMAPVFTGMVVMPACARVKLELDSGKYARDIPAYEDIVRRACASVAPAFIDGIVSPMLLCSLGMPLHLGAALGWLYAALRALRDRHAFAGRFFSFMHRLSARLLVWFMLLCSGVVGRNPLHTKGRSPADRLLSILGIAGDGTDTHAPMAGDISQAAFLCVFASVILCFSCCAVGFVLCR